jgi:hypothetical protein
MYARQLHAYALALENPSVATTKFSPITKLGLVCMHPIGIVPLNDDDLAYRVSSRWIEIPRDDKQFSRFLEFAVAVLEMTEPPRPSLKCEWCQMELQLAA